MRWILVVGVAVFAGCTKPPPPRHAPVVAPVISREILNRPVQTSSAMVRHILIGWGALAPNYLHHAPMDARARARDQVSAAELVRSIEKRLADGEDFGALEKQYSEDVLASGANEGFEVRADAQLEPAFQALALRLRVGEVGVCQSAYGYHLVQRLK